MGQNKKIELEEIPRFHKLNQIEQEQAYLAKFLSVIHKKLIAADLPLLRLLASSEEPTKNKYKKAREADNPRVVLPPHEGLMLYRIEEFEALKKTDWSKIEQWINVKLKEHRVEILKKFDAKLIRKNDPATIASLCSFLITRNFQYWDELVDFGMNKAFTVHHYSALTKDGKESLHDMQKVDFLPFHELLEKDRLVCRHFTWLTWAFFRVFKNRDTTGNLRNAELYEMSIDENVIISDHVYSDAEHHAAMLLVDAGADTLSLSAFDPTFLIGYLDKDEKYGKVNHVLNETFNISRFPFIMDFITKAEMYQDVTSKYYDWKSLRKIVGREIANIESLIFSGDLMPNNPLDRYDIHTRINVLAGYYQVYEKLKARDHNVSPFHLMDGYSRALHFMLACAEEKIKADAADMRAGAVAGAGESSGGADLSSIGSKINFVTSDGTEISVDIDPTLKVDKNAALVARLKNLKEPMNIGLSVIDVLDCFNQIDDLLTVFGVLEQTINRFGSYDEIDFYYSYLTSHYTALLNIKIDRGHPMHDFLDERHISFLKLANTAIEKRNADLAKKDELNRKKESDGKSKGKKKK